MDLYMVHNFISNIIVYYVWNDVMTLYTLIIITLIGILYNIKVRLVCIICSMEFGTWDKSKMIKYNLVDAVSCSTIQVCQLTWYNNHESSSYVFVDFIVIIAQVYPFARTAIFVKLDNQGIWNLRSQNAEYWYFGQELYIRVKAVEWRL